MTTRHPWAVIEEGASLHPTVSVGAFAVIERGAVLGAHVTVSPHAVIRGETTLGAGCAVHPFAVVGDAPQDRRHDGSNTRTELGRAVIVREHATIHRGTTRGGGVTRVGDDAMVMVGAHIAHDCDVGRGVVLANGVALAGHVTVEDHVTFGGMAVVGQYLRVGEGAMVAAGARVETDVPPFHIVSGDRARVRGLNTVGLSRRGTPDATVRLLVELHRALYRSDTPLATALASVNLSEDAPREALHLVRFLRASLDAPRRRTSRLTLP